MKNLGGGEENNTILATHFPNTQTTSRHMVCLSCFLSSCLSARFLFKLSVGLSGFIVLSLCQSFCPPGFMSCCLSVLLSVCGSVCPSVCLCVCPSVCLSVCPSVSVCLCPSVCRSICQSGCLFVKDCCPIPVI